MLGRMVQCTMMLNRTIVHYRCFAYMFLDSCKYEPCMYKTHTRCTQGHVQLCCMACIYAHQHMPTMSVPCMYTHAIVCLCLPCVNMHTHVPHINTYASIHSSHVDTSTHIHLYHIYSAYTHITACHEDTWMPHAHICTCIHHM